MSGYPIIVLRHPNGSLRAFHNACRHRGSLLLTQESGRVGGGCITCPYHSWTFELDGTLRKAPYFDTVEGFDRTKYSLFEIPCEQWNGLVFVCLAPPPKVSLSQAMSEVSRSFLSTYDFSAFEYHSTLLLDIRCNWKVFVDGFLECYHCPRLHPLFAREYDLTRYRTENGARYSLHTCPRKSNTTTTTTTTPPSDNVLGTADGLWYWIYPNTCLSLYEKYYDTIQVLPMGPLRTRLLVTFYGRKDLPRDQVDEAIKAVSRQTFQEDVDACERVQRVLESGGPYVSGPLHPQKEAAVILFQSLVRQAVEEGAKKKRSEGRPLGDVQRCCVDIEDLGSRC